ATGTAGGGQRERAGVTALGDPRAEEVVLEHRDPAAGDLQVERAVVDEVLVVAPVVLAAAEPRRALEAVLLHAHRTGRLERTRHAAELAVDEALPRRGAVVDHLVADLHHVVTAVEGVGAADGHAVGAGPGERNHHLLLA